MSTDLIQAGYLVASILFVLGIKNLSHPRTASRGNALGSTGMAVAVVVTIADRSLVSYTTLAAGLVVGAGIGAVLALRVQMTGMPQLVGLFNGSGGAASALVGIASLITAADNATDTTQLTVGAASTIAIGSATFSGSTIAVAKLSEKLNRVRHGYWARILTALAAAATVSLSVAIVLDPGTRLWGWLLIGTGIVLGAAIVAPIGGADMPVVVALLNSLSGLAAAGTGFVLDNPVLIVAGSLVGASGLILTGIMCRAMNRTLTHVLFAEMTSHQTDNDDDIYAGRVTSSSADEVAMMLDGAQLVAFVPGYGMAVAQAQHAVRDLCQQLQTSGTEVVFAIHPVAGRMPGHMNVLLAEAEVPYEQLIEMEEINPRFRQVDVAVVIGANDVVNPSAQNDPDSPIAGMPILDAHNARTVVVIKRSLSPGFAGIANPLFAADNTVMLFGDGREAVSDITRSLRETTR